MPKSFTLNDLPHSERPRERLQKFGPESLSAQELLALILGRGVRGESVMVTAQKLLSHFGSIKGIAEASLEDLQQIKGLGPAKAAQIAACFQLGKRLVNHETEEAKEKANISTPDAIYKLINSKIKNYSKEHFFVISLDTRNNFLGIDEISVGTLNANLVHPRETFEAAIRRHASSIIIAHNHPSGDPEPSEADIQITKQLKQVGEVVGIHLLDHIIVSKTIFCSLKQRRLI